MKSMHKTALTVLAISGMSCMMINSAFASSVSQSIEFTASGSVISNPCQVAVTPTVQFANLNPTNLHLSNTYPTNPQKITIDITSCPANTKLNASVSGTIDTHDYNLLQLSNHSDPEAATNVGIGFWKENKALLPVSTGVTDDSVTDASGAAQINLVTALALVSSGLQPTSGSIEASASIKINYL